MDQIITISVEINSTIEMVWEHWTNPDHIVNWNFASDDWCCPSAQNDVSVGGKFSWRMEAKDGSMGFDFEGEYTKVIPHELLVYKLDDGRPVKIVFEQEGGMIKLIETFQGEDENALEMQRRGWLAILKNFKKEVESE